MGGQNATAKEKLNEAKEKSKKEFNDMMDNDFEIRKKKIKNERNGDLNCNLTIRVYSNERCCEKYKNYLNSIKMDEWNIIYLEGFSQENTDKLIEIYKNKSKNKKNFDEVLVIIIDSFESFINMTKEEGKNLFEQFNNNLFAEEQPFFFFLNKDMSELEYIQSKSISVNEDYEVFEKVFLDVISESKDEYNIEICYSIHFNEPKEIIDFLENKKKRNDNFKVIFDNDLDFIYNSQYNDDEVMTNFIHELLQDRKKVIINNLDYNIKLSEDFKILNNLSITNDIKFYIKYYKPAFKKSFEDYLEQYKLLDKRNFKLQNYYYIPYKDFQSFCGYYHEYGDALIKDKFVKYPSKINIGVCGRAGAGKSTLLNVILGEKRCLEGQGTSVSNFIVSYSHPNYPIYFIDFPGFGDKNHASNLIKKIREKNSLLKEIREQFHMILYCIKFGERTFLDREEDVIDELLKFKVKIIFVFTKGDKEDTPAFKRFKNNFLKDLSNILLKKNINIEEKDIDVVSVYSMKEETHGFIIESFGLDILFELIYKYLKEKKVPKEILEEIELTEDEKKLDEIIKSTELMKINESRKQLLSSIRKRVFIMTSFFMSRFLLTFPRHYFKKTDNFAIGLIKELNDLMIEASSIYCKILDKDESNKLKNTIMQNISSFFNFGEEFTEEITNTMPWYIRIIALIFYPIHLVIGGISFPILSIKISNLICDGFEEDGKINIKSYLYNFGIGLNEGIEGTKKLSEEFKKSYEKK